MRSGTLPWTDHSRQGSQSSLLGSSTSSSPSLPAKTTFLELPSTSRTQVDKEALDAVKEAVEVAPAVWDMMDEIFSDVPETNIDVRESLERAKLVTKRLTDNIRAVQQGDSSADRKTLREDAHVFLKVMLLLRALSFLGFLVLTGLILLDRGPVIEHHQELWWRSRCVVDFA